VALTTQTGQASAQAGQPDTGAAVGASSQTDAAGQDCGECAGQGQGAQQGSGDGASQECPGDGAAQECPGGNAQGGQTSGQTGASDDGESCCPY
jgi:hypothetical protein